MLCTPETQRHEFFYKITKKRQAIKTHQRNIYTNRRKHDTEKFFCIYIWKTVENIFVKSKTKQMCIM